MPGQKNFIALEATSQEILRKVTKIELVTATVVSGNPFDISFQSVSDLIISGGYWDSSAKINF